MISFYNFTVSGLQALLEENGLSPSAAGRLFNWHYKQRNFGPCLKDIAKSTQGFIAQKMSFDLPVIDLIQES